MPPNAHVDVVEIDVEPPAPHIKLTFGLQSGPGFAKSSRVNAIGMQIPTL